MPAGSLGQYVLKLHSRCDLACDHCYVYEHADQSWRRRPHRMAWETVRAAAARIREHAVAHRLPKVHIVLHGGEPLLVGRAAMRASLAELRATIGPATQLDLRMQTNGVLLDRRWCELLAEHEVMVGISLDGDRDSNDRHRRFASGTSSYPQVMRAVALLRRPEYRRIFAGILCTVDVANDPIRVYEALVAQRPPRIDLLLPHATWDSPPPRSGRGPEAYGAWMRRVYERWTQDGRPVPIRIFDSLLALAAGGTSAVENVGAGPVDLAVIETDGAWEQADSIKTAYDGAPGTGLNVFDHSADEVAAHPALARRRRGIADLCATCRACPLVRQCGGGLYAHRYRTGSGFDNPSVYCADLAHLIKAIHQRPTAGPAKAADGTPPMDLVDALAGGHGDAEAIDQLVQAQWGINRGLVAAVAAAHPDGGTRVASAWRLLRELDQRAPAATRAVLTHPFVRAWATGCLHGGREGAGAFLANLAAAAAIRAGVEVQLDVIVTGGRAHIPGVGTAVLPAAGPAAVVSTKDGALTVRAGWTTVTVHAGGEGGPGWLPARWVGTDGLHVLLEDQDPHRDLFGATVPKPLPAVAVRSWERTLGEAWRLVRDEAPGQVASVTGVLRLITPLTRQRAVRHRSAATRHAFGAIAASHTTYAATLAVSLVHETQHGKLGALMDLHDLVDPQCGGTVPVGWRPDPRPVDAALQGAYAHLAVAGIWGVRARTPGPSAGPAVALHRRYRDWTAAAIDRLRVTGALTPAGVRFIDGMARAMEAFDRSGTG